MKRYHRRLVALAASLAAFAGAGVAMATSAGAATGPCGTFCVSVYSQKWGPNHILNGNNNGNVRLRSGSNSFTNEDVTIGPNSIEPVWWFEENGIISKGSYAFVHYPNHLAAELEFAPGGFESGVCVGVARPSFNGEGLTKVPCGNSAQTLWVFDTNHAASGLPCFKSGNPCPLINGSNQNFSQPMVMTARGESQQLQVQPEHITSGLLVSDGQEWTYNLGPFVHTP